jgi:hypothetical protein
MTWQREPFWLQIEDDGTDRIHRVSDDGFHWVEQVRESRTAFLTADEVFWGGDVRSLAYDAAKIWLVHWEETTP